MSLHGLLQEQLYLYKEVRISNKGEKSEVVGKDFLSLHVVQTGFGPHPASYPLGTRSSFLGMKRPGSESDHSLPTSADVKNV
jgi:hypothetical protein